jgi:hypothetical protein
MLAILALSVLGRHPVYGRVDILSVLALVGLAAASVVVSYLAVRGYA